MLKLSRTPKAKKARLAAYFAVALLGVAIFFGCARGPDAPAGAVHVLTATGVVNPVMDMYLDRGISAAEDEQAAAVIIRLDTPGGLVTSMDDIVRRILAADVPVVVYVYPPGGQAASAGTFITYASHVAAMAPATVIGSATPVAGGGEDIEGDMRNKVIENAVAKIRGLAIERDRNADWGEAAVRDGISSEWTEALELNVVDLIASDLDDLIAQIDGRTVELEGEREVVIQAADAPVVFNNRNFIENILGFLANPTVAFLLLSLGSLAIFIEIINPGQIFPGVFGVIALLMGFFALSVFPFNVIGLVLIFFAFILFGLEIFVSSGGILGIGGVVALVLGGLLLTAGNPPEVRVDPLVVYILAAILGAMVLFVLVNVIRIRRMPAQIGMETLIGKHAVARSTLSPTGYVFLEGEMWSAETQDEPVEPGEKVIITEVQGLKLKVMKEQQQDQPQQSEGE
jgi:membrane-bound serine protease (ClpP class)